jgi:hypothetical protein
MQINGYNGGLFASDPDLDGLQVADASLDGIEALAGYDFETDLNVNILGHIFEQSISDLEALRAEIRGEAADAQRSRRKRDGIFYTPELITSFMVARTIGGWLAEREAEIEASHRTGKPGPMAKETRLKVMLDYLEVLKHIKVLDPACGSGAFLVAAFDYLIAEYERVNAAIAELTGAPQQLGLFDLDRQILQDNLFGVDLNRESVEITKLSLWLKTARRDKPLNNLDANIRCGNSLVEPPGPKATAALREAFAALPADSRAFDWRVAFPAVFERGGFDVVIGNPPYVRQEALGTLKGYLAQCYASYSGVADLYVYFYERGLDLLAPGGKLSYIVTNKWMRAGYGEPLRRLFSERAVFEEMLDFGHAPIFEDADTFPCIIVARRRPAAALDTAASAPDPEPPAVSVCPVPRERSAELSLDNYVHEHAYPVPWSRYGAAPWSLEPPAVDALMQRIRERGTPLAEFLGVKPMYGIKTGTERGLPDRRRHPHRADSRRPRLCRHHQALPARAGHQALGAGLAGVMDDRAEVQRRPRLALARRRRSAPRLSSPGPTRACTAHEAVAGAVDEAPGPGAVLVGAAVVRLLARVREAEDRPQDIVAPAVCVLRLHPLSS